MTNITVMYVWARTGKWRMKRPMFDVKEAQIVGAKRPKSPPSTALASLGKIQGKRFDGSEVFQLSSEKVTVLDRLLEVGHPWPFRAASSPFSVATRDRCIDYYYYSIL